MTTTLNFEEVIKDVHDEDNQQLHVIISQEYVSIFDVNVNTMDFGGVIKDSHDQDNRSLRLKTLNGYIIIGVI